MMKVKSLNISIKMSITQRLRRISWSIKSLEQEVVTLFYNNTMKVAELEEKDTNNNRKLSATLKTSLIAAQVRGPNQR